MPGQVVARPCPEHRLANGSSKAPKRRKWVHAEDYIQPVYGVTRDFLCLFLVNGEGRIGIWKDQIMKTNEGGLDGKVRKRERRRRARRRRARRRRARRRRARRRKTRMNHSLPPQSPRDSASTLRLPYYNLAFSLLLEPSSDGKVG
jgi:hypothetical protein